MSITSPTPQELRAQAQELLERAEAQEAALANRQVRIEEARQRHQENRDTYGCLAGEVVDPDVLRTVKRGYSSFTTPKFQALYQYDEEAQALADKADDAMSDLFRLVYGKEL